MELFSRNVLYIYNRFQKSEKSKCLSRIYAALKNFGPAFEELNKRSALRTALVKYCSKIIYKRHENTASVFRFVPIRHICKAYIIDTCATKTHPHLQTIATLRPNACILLFAFLKIHKVICKLKRLFSSFTYLPNFII